MKSRKTNVLHEFIILKASEIKNELLNEGVKKEIV